MSDQNSTSENQGQKTTEKIKPMAAASASLAQSLAFTAQSEVDALRNQNTVNMVAMGSAYAKWLQNPMMGEAFQQIIDKSSLINEEVLDDYVDIIEKVDRVKNVRLATKIMNQCVKS